MFYLFISLISVPFLGALLVAPLRRRAADGVAALISGATLLIAIMAIFRSFGSSWHYITGDMPWLSLREPLIGIQVDALSQLLLIVITAVGFLVVLYSAGYMSEWNKEHPTQSGKGRYYFFLLLFIGSMVGLVLSPDFLQLFIFWELTTLCSWALISYYGTKESVSAGFKALVITHAAGLFFLAALLIIYYYTNSFAFEAIAELSGSVKTMVIIFLLIAAWGKAAQFPFFTWLPTAMAAPTPASAYLHAAAMVKAGIYLTARMLVSAGVVSPDIGILMGSMALITMYIGAIFYFFQDDLKRLLAFSTIAHLSYMLIGLSLGVMGSALAFKGGLLHLINHSFTKSLLFLAVGAISCATGTRSMNELSGLGKRMPVTTTAFVIGALAISGIPPFNIFWSKFFIIAGAIKIGTTWGWFAGILALLESVITFAWFLVVVHKVFFGPCSLKAQKAQDPPLTMLVPLIILMICSIISPYFSLPLIEQVMGG
ncbi:MAG: hydrogenase 4 subunit D [Thermoactinomyces sp.]